MTSTCLRAGSQGGHFSDPGPHPRDTLLPRLDSHHNQSQRNQHSLTRSNSHSGRPTAGDSHSLLETLAEMLSPAEPRANGDARTQVHLDAVTRSVQREAATGTSADNSADILVRVQQVSAVHTANTERYGGRAARINVHSRKHFNCKSIELENSLFYSCKK